MSIVVSACLAGDNCTYKGTSNLISGIKALTESKEAIKICPEVLGGLPVPRDYAEISGGDGSDVLKGDAKVQTKSGADVTHAFLKGARNSYDIAKDSDAKLAVLRSKSPSCGCGEIYDGSFSNKLKRGYGVTAALFASKGIKVITEKQFIKGLIK